MIALVPGTRFTVAQWRDTDASAEFYVIATESSRTDPMATNYRLACIIDGRGVRAAAIATGRIVPRNARASAAAPAVLLMDYWGLVAAADDIFVEFNEGVDDDGNREGLERQWIVDIIERHGTRPVIKERLQALLDGTAEDWPIAKEKRFEEQRAMREEFCARQPDEIEECESNGEPIEAERRAS